MVLLAYLLGSIPSAVWIGKFLYGIDPRNQGSGNAGTTNVFRVLGKKAGIPVFIIDVAKGSLAAGLPFFWVSLFPEKTHLLSRFSMAEQSLTCGIMSVVGHIYPIFAGFKGGKGIATLLGMMLVANPAAAGISALVFVIVLLISKYVSLGSIVAVAAFPLYSVIKNLLADQAIDLKIGGLGLGLFLLVCFTHRTNIKRLIQGNENKIGKSNKLPTL